ncbi:hypothetical protein NLI96_g8479 [Meripilus lineatus]|uniref:Uncharacterized protein n=1 Tax=Meripilus lineatus TaxID=2056292 RepID=A0AAD5V2F7_9APHY|nr:hypothetical protein NLI96_g8479 [Physisporinus lineatus]
MAAPQQNYFHQQPFYPPSQPHEQVHYIPEHEDTKAPYDDLIDQYATPYRQNSQHKAYTVNPAAFNPSEQTLPYSSSTHKPTVSEVTSKDLEGSSSQGHDWGYPPVPPPVDKEKDKEKENTNWLSLLVPDSIACRLYVLVVLIETAIDLAIEADLFLRFKDYDIGEENRANNKMPVYLAVFCLAHVFQFVMAVDAVYARNTLQFIFLTIFNAMFLLYSIIQIQEINDLIPSNTPGFSHIPINVLTTVIPIVIAVSELAYILLGWKIYTEFGWKVYKFLGADRQIKTMYAHYQVFLCLVKFDLFFWVGFSVQFIWLVLNPNDAEYYLTCAAFPLSIIVLIEGHLAARYENKWMMLTFMGGCVGALVYFLYKLVKVLRFRNEDTFILVWKTMTTFSILAIFLLIGTFIVACLVMRNFGRGLKTQITKNQGGLKRGKTQYVHRGPMATHPNRMSID